LPAISAQGMKPLRQQAGLAITGRRYHQRELNLAFRVESSLQPWPLD
jgi:hypothetical protein